MIDKEKTINEIKELVRSLARMEGTQVRDDDDVYTLNLKYNPVVYACAQEKIEKMKKQGVSEWGQILYLISQAEDTPSWHIDDIRDKLKEVNNDT